MEVLVEVCVVVPVVVRVDDAVGEMVDVAVVVNVVTLSQLLNVPSFALTEDAAPLRTVMVFSQSFIVEKYNVPEMAHLRLPSNPGKPACSGRREYSPITFWLRTAATSWQLERALLLPCRDTWMYDFAIPLLVVQWAKRGSPQCPRTSPRRTAWSLHL